LIRPSSHAALILSNTKGSEVCMRTGLCIRTQL
jgi:hypothetical protein